jgi:hypothetical protein
LVHRIVFGLDPGQGMGVRHSSFGDDYATVDAWHGRLAPHYGLTGPVAATSYLEFPQGAVLLRRLPSTNEGRNSSVALVGSRDQLADRAPYFRFRDTNDVVEARALTVDDLDVRTSSIAGWDDAAADRYDAARPVVAALLAGVGHPVAVVGTPSAAIPSVVHLVRRVLRPVLGDALPLTYSETERDDNSRGRPGLPALVFLPAWPHDIEAGEHTRIDAAVRGPQDELAGFLLDRYGKERLSGLDSYARWIERTLGPAGEPAARVARLEEVRQPRRIPSSLPEPSPAVRPDARGLPAGPVGPDPAPPDDDAVDRANEAGPVHGAEPPKRPGDREGRGIGRVDRDRRLDEAGHAARADHDRDGGGDRDTRAGAAAPAGATAADIAATMRMPLVPDTVPRPPDPALPCEVADLIARIRTERRRERRRDTLWRRASAARGAPRGWLELQRVWVDTPHHEDALRQILEFHYGSGGGWLRRPGNVRELADLAYVAPWGMCRGAWDFARAAGVSRRFRLAFGTRFLDALVEPPLPGNGAPLLARLRRWWYYRSVAVLGSAVGGALLFLAGYLLGGRGG